MRRPSATLYSILNTSNKNLLNLNQLASQFSTKANIFKKSISLNRNSNDIIKSLHTANNNKIHNIQRRFYKDVKTQNIIKTNEIKEKYNKADIYKKFIAFRKNVYKKTFIDKYSNPYLILNSLKKEVYINNSKKPRLFHCYLINYILEKKQCLLYFKYNELMKEIDENDFLIIYFNYKQSYNIIKYLLGCIYSHDRYVYNSIIDNRNHQEIIINNYKITMRNIIEHFNKNKFQNIYFLLNQYVSKLEKKDDKYYINNKKYKYIFVEEIPNSLIPRIRPNYLSFHESIKNFMNKNYDKYKLENLITKHFKYIEKQKLIENNQNKDLHNNRLLIGKNDSSNNEKDNSQIRLDYNRDIYEKIKRSFYDIEKNKDNSNYSFSSSESMELKHIFNSKNKNNKNYLANNFFFFPKQKLDNIDKRIKYDIDVLEIEKLLNNNFKPKNSLIKEKALKTPKKDDIIKENIVHDNFLLSNNKYPNKDKTKLTSKNLNNNSINEKFKINNTQKIKESKFPLLIKSTFSKKEILESYNNKNKNLFINNIINKNNKNNKNKNELKSLSYNNKKNLLINKNNRKENTFDYKKLIYNLITNKNYTSYNKKSYRLKTDSNKNISKKKNENKKFKKIQEFLKDYNINNKLLVKSNKLISNLIVNSVYKKKHYNRNKKKFFPVSLSKQNNELYEYYELENSLFHINQVYNKINRNKRREKTKNKTFFHNFKTSNEILKYVTFTSDIYSFN